MNNFSTHWLIKILLFVMFGFAVFAACQPNEPTTPTPFATATPQPSSTPTVMRSFLETAVPTSTLQPTLTRSEPTPTFTPLPGGLIPLEATLDTHFGLLAVTD